VKHIQKKIESILDRYNYDDTRHEISSYIVMIGVIDSRGKEQLVCLNDGLVDVGHTLDYMQWLGMLKKVAE
jgi:hypothetical protein